MSRPYERYAKNTIGSGSYSFIKTRSRKEVMLFTESNAKLSYLRAIGVATGWTEEVRVKTYYGDIEDGWKAMPVRKLTKPNAYHQSRYNDEVRRFDQADIYRVRDLNKLDLKTFPILAPAIQFLMDYFGDAVEVSADMHDENILIDPATGNIIPYDVFNLDYMEKYA